ncbi:melanoma-associated antigen B17 [Ochotona curzoniae]|uniref:melanoma-associated antigen B17 n=1 Tax=Ochotona curzoniae TaxID=130825 RepID=UPI001B345F51|nr:melanoma-associated antigen B17 [Ochotona curzoniae]
MPRGQKSKLRNREKRRQARDHSQDPKDAEAMTAEEGKSPSCSSPVARQAAPSTAGIPQGSQGTREASPAAACSSAGKGGKNREKGDGRCTRVQALSQGPKRDPKTKKVDVLMQLLLHKYKMKESILKADVLSIVGKKYRKHFPDILRRTRERMELVFGLELNESNRGDESYDLVCKLELSSKECLDDGRGFPKTGILLPLLGMIFVNGQHVSEEDTWAFLNMLGVHDGKPHFIFGEPRKLITNDLVKEKYLEYVQVPNSDPPRYEFSWGPKAHLEVNKFKIMEFLAKVKGTAPSNFQSRYEVALKEEEARARAKKSGKHGAATPASVPARRAPQP